MAESSAPLAVILYSGEPSLPGAIASIEGQEEVSSRFILIGNHPKHQAHQRLYRILNDYRTEHEFAIFLGADMAISAPRLFVSLRTLFLEFPRLDHVLLGVDDWYSGEHQLGVNVWRRGVKHGSSPNRLFTDLAKSSSRLRLKIERPRVPLILHGIDPSDHQAVRYGAQRAMKAAASGKMSRWQRLEALVEFSASNPDPQRLLALAGVRAAIKDEALGSRCISGTADLSEPELKELRRSAQSELLIDELRGMVKDTNLRMRLVSERQSETQLNAARPPNLSSRLARKRRSGADLAEAEKRFFEVLNPLPRGS